MAATAQHANYFELSSRKCVGGSPQAVIDPNTGLPMPQGAGAVVFPPAKAVQSQVGVATRPISTDASKQAFSAATQQQQAPIQAGLGQANPNVLAAQQAMIDQTKAIQNQAMAVAVAECAAGRSKATPLVADQESLKAAFGKMTETMKTRRYKLSTTFTMRRAAVNGVKIGVSKENKHIFQLRNPDGGGRIGLPETAILLGARLLTAYSNCGAEVGVKMTGAKGNTYSPAGSRFVFTLDYKERLQYGREGLVIHQISEILDVRRLDRYGHLTMEDIRKTIFPVPNLGISFVTVTSPVVYVIEKNKEMLHIPADSFQPVENQFHLISNDIVEHVLAEIDRSFFKKMPFTDLSNFHLSLERTDGRKWNDPVGVESYTSGSSGEQQAGTYFLTKPNRFNCWIELDYVLTNVKSSVVQGDGTVSVASAASPINANAAAPSLLTTGF